jgi:C_GCAxxG_C_C family probable redox protein
MDDLAFQMFKLVNLGYCCTQVMMKMALDEEEKENDDLLRAVNGLCMGVGNAQKTCGVLTGGIAILGLYAGKGNDIEYPSQEYSRMVDEYREWFESEFGSTECVDIIGVCSVTDYTTNQEYRLKCGDTLKKSYEKIPEILRNHNFEFGNRE